MGRKKTHEEIVLLINSIHGGSIELLEGYKNTSVLTSFICKICNNTWKASLSNVIYNGSKCPKCNKKRKSELATNTEGKKILHFNIFKEKFIEKHGDQYKIIGSYVNARTKIEIICPKHGVFYSKPSHINCCNQCAIEKRTATQQDFIEKVKMLEGDNYLVLSEYKNNHTKVKMFHTKCEKTFLIKPNHFIDSEVRCSHCNSSKGEQRIEDYLLKNFICYQKQYTFRDLKSNKNYAIRFDFCVNYHDILILIEYDGKQHFEPIDHFGGIDKFTQLQENDYLKNDYCRKNDIPLIRIPYWSYEEIADVLLTEFEHISARLCHYA